MVPGKSAERQVCAEDSDRCCSWLAEQTCCAGGWMMQMTGAASMIRHARVDGHTTLDLDPDMVILR